MPDREFEEIDAVLGAALGGVTARASVMAAARARIARERRVARPSPVPEILDFIGWAATLTTVALLVPRLLPLFW